jgi:hypothetical protein
MNAATVVAYRSKSRTRRRLRPIQAKVRQRLPLAAGPQQVKKAVENLAHVDHPAAARHVVPAESSAPPQPILHR